MNENQRIFNAFTKLGDFLRKFCDLRIKKDVQQVRETDNWSQKLEDTITLAGHKNGWFTKENVFFALQSWGVLLKEDALSTWLSTYDLTQNREKTVAIIMAGNIPLVGFHDLMTVLITGNKAMLKLSSNDNVLTLFIKDYLISVEPLFQDKILIPKGKLEGFDAVIATGSNNTARYFEYYFGKVPNIIRKNRNSVAVLTGDESKDQLEALGKDIFKYYGLGCRSVSKLLVPEGYDFDNLFTSIYGYSHIVQQNKYANNYDYNKAVYLMSDFKILDNGFLVLKEDDSYASPIASLFYEYYSNLTQVRQRLIDDADKLQCVVAEGILDNEVAFGVTQIPYLDDYADGVDTVDFLLRN